jgi:AmmeMemoRadiSam system protein B
MARAPSIQPVKERPTAVAGRFYPAHPAELRRMIESCLSQVKLDNAVAPKAVIAPHAGYLYSGPIAASAHARFASARHIIKRIVLIGPSHYVSFGGLAVSSAHAFATPLGLVPVDTESVRQICALPQVTVADEAHAREHALEVQLPFLQVVLGDFSIVPLVVSDARAEAVAEVIDWLWGGVETRFVISSDLSHYLDYASARELDSSTSRSIERLCPQDIGEEQACGRAAICGLLQAARQHGLRARAVDLRNSGDTAGPRSEVVGYGAFAFEGA